MRAGGAAIAAIVPPTRPSLPAVAAVVAAAAAVAAAETQVQCTGGCDCLRDSLLDLRGPSSGLASQ